MPVLALESGKVGPGHSGVEFDPRIALFHRRVRPAGDMRTRIQQRLPGISPHQPLIAQPSRSEMQITDGVRGLEGSDHTQLRKARNVGRIDDLAVLVAPARFGQSAFFRRHLSQGFLDPVQEVPVAAVADGVDIHLHPVAQGLGHQRDRLVRLGDCQSGGFRTIGIRLQQRCAARAQRAVHVQLHRPRDHPPVIRHARRLRRQPGIAVRIDRDIAADRQTVLRRQPLDHLHILPGHRHVMRTGPAQRSQALCALGINVGPFRTRRRGNQRRHGPHRSVDQHAGRLAGFVEQDFPACRRNAVTGNTRRLQHGRIGHQGMSVGADQGDRIVRRHRVQILTIGETALRPVRLDPAATGDEGTGLCRVHSPLHARDQISNRNRRVQIQRAFALANAEDMDMAVGETGIHCPAIEIDNTGLRPDQAADIQLGTGKDDAPVIHRHSLDLRLGVIGGVDRPAPEHDIGRHARRDRRMLGIIRDRGLLFAAAGGQRHKARGDCDGTKVNHAGLPWVSGGG